MHEDANMHSCNKVEACDSFMIIPLEREQLIIMLLSKGKFFKHFSSYNFYLRRERMYPNNVSHRKGILSNSILLETLRTSFTNKDKAGLHEPFTSLSILFLQFCLLPTSLV
jgi:hypothetical protein